MLFHSFLEVAEKARVFLKRRPKNEDLRPKTPWTKTKTLGLKRRPTGLKRRPPELKRRPFGLKRRLLGLKRRPFGLNEDPLDKTEDPLWILNSCERHDNTRFGNLLRRFGNVVEFSLRYLIVIVKSITYLFFKRCFRVSLCRFL